MRVQPVSLCQCQCQSHQLLPNKGQPLLPFSSKKHLPFFSQTPSTCVWLPSTLHCLCAHLCLFRARCREAPRYSGIPSKSPRLDRARARASQARARETILWYVPIPASASA